MLRKLYTVNRWAKKKKIAKPLKSLIILAMFDYDFKNHLSVTHVYCASLMRFFLSSFYVWTFTVKQGDFNRERGVFIYHRDSTEQRRVFRSGVSSESRFGTRTKRRVPTLPAEYGRTISEMALRNSRVGVVVAFEKVAHAQAIQFVYTSLFCLYSVWTTSSPCCTYCRMSQPACSTRFSATIFSRNAIRDYKRRLISPLSVRPKYGSFSDIIPFVASRSLFILLETTEFETLSTRYTSREPYFWNARIFIAFAFAGVLAHASDDVVENEVAFQRYCYSNPTSRTRKNFSWVLGISTWRCQCISPSPNLHAKV